MTKFERLRVLVLVNNLFNLNFVVSQSSKILTRSNNLFAAIAPFFYEGGKRNER